MLETVSRHYAIPLCNNKKFAADIGYTTQAELILIVSEDTLLGENDKQIRKKAIKLHRQFSHCTANQMKMLLKNAGFEQEKYFNMIDEITENCELCLKYKKVKPRPVVGLSCGRSFNDIVAMDLKALNKDVTILHMIDMVT